MWVPPTRTTGIWICTVLRLMFWTKSVIQTKRTCATSSRKKDMLVSSAERITSHDLQITNMFCDIAYFPDLNFLLSFRVGKVLFLHNKSVSSSEFVTNTIKSIVYWVIKWPEIFSLIYFQPEDLSSLFYSVRSLSTMAVTNTRFMFQTIDYSYYYRQFSRH